MKNWIGQLLRIANSHPVNKTRFYAMKSRILHRFGKIDDVPFDIQFIHGKKCCACGGTGNIEEYCGDYDNKCTCDRCGGNGWWKDPVWVPLRRWTIGFLLFHEPISRTLKAPELQPNIVGYVEHQHFRFKSVWRATFILALLFDWRFAWYLFVDLMPFHFRRSLWRIRTFRARRKIVVPVQKSVVKATFVNQDEEMPF